MIRSLFIATIFISTIAQAGWIKREAVIERDERDEPTSIASVLTLADGLRNWLSGLQLTHKSLIYIYKIKYINRIYTWDGECDLYPKGHIEQRETSVAEGYFLTSPDQPMEFWHHVSNAMPSCNRPYHGKNDKPNLGMRRAR